MRSKFEVARQATSLRLCASVRAVPWADETEQQLSRLAPSGCQLSADVCIFTAGLPDAPGTNLLSHDSSLRLQDKQTAPVSLPVCKQCHGQMRIATDFQARPFWLPAICRHSHFRSRAAEGARHTHPNIRFKFEVARQASSTSLRASVRAVPWAHEAEQQLSRLAPSGCQLSSDIRILGAGLPEPPCMDPLRYV